jgi:hypothetical protein
MTACPTSWKALKSAWREHPNWLDIRVLEKRNQLKEGIGGERRPKDKVKTGWRQGYFVDNSIRWWLLQGIGHAVVGYEQGLPIAVIWQVAKSHLQMVFIRWVTMSWVRLMAIFWSGNFDQFCHTIRNFVNYLPPPQHVLCVRMHAIDPKKPRVKGLISPMAFIWWVAMSWVWPVALIWCGACQRFCCTIRDFVNYLLVELTMFKMPVACTWSWGWRVEFPWENPMRGGAKTDPFWFGSREWAHHFSQKSHDVTMS